MSKIGTAHIELKPVLDEDALSTLTDRIADAVALGVERGMAAANKPVVINFTPAMDGVLRHIDAEFAGGAR